MAKQNTTNIIISRLKSIISSLNDEVWAEDEDFDYKWSMEVENINNLTSIQYRQKIYNDLRLKDCETEIYGQYAIQVNKLGQHIPFWVIEVIDSDSTNRDNIPFIFIGLRIIN